MQLTGIFWYDYQTLIAGILAIIAAGISLWGLRLISSREIAAAEESHKRELSYRDECRRQEEHERAVAITEQINAELNELRINAKTINDTVPNYIGKPFAGTVPVLTSIETPAFFSDWYCANYFDNNARKVIAELFGEIRHYKRVHTAYISGGDVLSEGSLEAFKSMLSRVIDLLDELIEIEEKTKLPRHRLNRSGDNTL